MSEVKSFIVPPGAYNLGNFPQSVDPWVPGSLAGVGSLIHVTTFDVETEVYGTCQEDMRCRNSSTCLIPCEFIQWYSVPHPHDVCTGCLWRRKEVEALATQSSFWRCECGAEAVGSDRHASYCPKFRR